MKFAVLLLAGACLASAANAQIHSVSDPSAFHPYAPTSSAKPTAAPGATAPAALPSSRQESLTDDSVIALVRAGLGPETIVAKINATPGTYDTSTDALIRLKQAGAPDSVIAAYAQPFEVACSNRSGRRQQQPGSDDSSFARHLFARSTGRRSHAAASTDRIESDQDF